MFLKGAKPCRAKRPTTEPPSTTTVESSTTRDSKAPCMAVFENMKEEEDGFEDYAMGVTTAASVPECSKTCETDVKCAYSFFKTNKCYAFERFRPTDFVKNGGMPLIFKVNTGLNSVTTATKRHVCR